MKSFCLGIAVGAALVIFCATGCDSSSSGGSYSDPQRGRTASGSGDSSTTDRDDGSTSEPGPVNNADAGTDSSTTRQIPTPRESSNQEFDDLSLNDPTDSAPRPDTAGSSAAKNDDLPAAATNDLASLEAPNEMPRVLLSEDHQKHTVIGQGDPMPEITLPDLDGQTTDLESLFGEKLTVLVFFGADTRRAKWQLMDLQPDIAESYASHGLKVIGIAHKMTPEQAKEVADETQTKFPILLDASGDAFARVATDYLPRTYLLSKAGKVLWFDIGYASATRRNLDQAIRYGLLHE